MRRSTASAQAPEAEADGRLLRSQRSGRRIVEALLELVGEGVVEPTAQQVAARAGVGIRTVFRRFSDMESLLAEVASHVEGEATQILRGGEPAGSMSARAQDLARRRCALFERIAPYKRSGNQMRRRSPFLRARHATLVRELRADLLRWLPELRRAPADVLEAVDLATSFESWDRLRSEQGLGRERALAALQRTVNALVATLER